MPSTTRPPLRAPLLREEPTELCRSFFREHPVDDVDAVRERVAALAVEIVLEPTDMPWGNRSMILRDPDGGLVNLFTPVTPEAKAKYGL